MPATTTLTQRLTVPASHAPEARTAEDLFEGYHGRLRSYCTRLVGDASTAEDVAQETLLRAWTRRDSFAEGADLAPWLFRVARNLCTDALRARARFSTDTQIPDRPALDADPLLPIERAETGEIVRRAFASLSERERRALTLRDIQGVDYSEVADRLGVTEQCARVVLLRARRGLRKRFLEFTSATAALVAITLGRARTALRDRLDPAVFQPVGFAVGQASIGFVAAAALLLGPTNPYPELGAVGTMTSTVDGDHIEATFETTPRVDGVEPPITTRLTDRHEYHTGATIRAQRNGEVRTRGSAPNPVTGGDAQLWADVERRADGGDSSALRTVDETSAAGCGLTAPACETTEGILR